MIDLKDTALFFAIRASMTHDLKYRYPGLSIGADDRHDYILVTYNNDSFLISKKSIEDGYAVRDFDERLSLLLGVTP